MKIELTEEQTKAFNRGESITLIQKPEFKSETIYFQGFKYKTIQSPTTGRIWLDRNLGAKEVSDHGGYFKFNEANCPDDYEVPSDNEWQKELPNNLKTDIAWLKTPLAGSRNTSGSFCSQGYYTSLWSRTETDGSAYKRYMYASFETVNRASVYKAYGLSVRLIKKEVTTASSLSGTRSMVSGTRRISHE